MLYVLTNRCFPGLTMICTESPEELDTEMVPLPFKVEYAAEVPNPHHVEVKLHQMFRSYSINPMKKFFQMDPAQAVAALRAFPGAA
jgi:hypothetical protein